MPIYRITYRDGSKSVQTLADRTLLCPKRVVDTKGRVTYIGIQRDKRIG